MLVFPPVSFSVPGSGLGSHIAFSCHISWALLSVIVPLSFLIFHDLFLFFMLFLQGGYQLFCRISLSLCLADIFSWLEFLARIPQKRSLSQHILSENAWYWYALLLVPLIMIFWRCQFLHCKITVIPCILKRSFQDPMDTTIHRCSSVLHKMS